VTRFIEIALVGKGQKERERERDSEKTESAREKGDPRGRQREDRRNYVCRGNLVSYTCGISKTPRGSVKVKVTRFSRPLVAKSWISYEEASPEPSSEF